MATIGIDPGARDTGIIAINNQGTVTGLTIHNDGPLLPITRAYLRQVITAVADLLDDLGPDTTIKTEGITRPNWHVGKNQGGGAAANPEALLGAAMVLGAITAHYPVITIPPGKHGSHPLGTYPPALVSKGEQRKPGWEHRVGTGKLRHQRSAWDIANTTPPTHTTRTAPGPRPADIHITDFREGRHRTA